MMTKQELRAAIRAKRDAIPPEVKKQADAEIVARIAASEVFANASAVLLYAPHGSEINLLPLVRICREQGKPVAFPRCNTADCTMQFFVLEPDARLIPGAYGIPEPPEDAPLCPLDARTLCILPGLTFDPHGNRLGYGKGYYDRFAALFSGVTAGVVYEHLAVANVPCEGHDEPVRLLFTQKRCYVCHPEPKNGQNDGPSVAPNGKKKITKDVTLPVPTASKEGQEGSHRAEEQAPKDRVLPENEAEEHALPSKKTARRRPAWGKHAPPALAAACFLLLLLSRLFEARVIDRGSSYAVVILLQLMVFFVPAAIYMRLRGEGLTSRIRFRLPASRHTWFTVCLAVVMIGGSLLLCILTGGISSLTGSFTLYDTFVARINNSAPLEIAYVILAYCILPAVCEELIFRALLCAEYEDEGVIGAVSISSLLFAMLHFSLPLFPAYLFLGALLVFSMYATRSLWTAVILHLAYNLFCLFGQPYLSAFYVRAGSNEIFLFCVITPTLLFAALGAGEARKIYHRYAREGKTVDYAVAVSPKATFIQIGRAFFTPFAWTCALIFLIMAIINLV